MSFLLKSNIASTVHLQKMSILRKTMSTAAASKVHGSYHWTLERAISIATIPATAAAFIVGPHPIVDLSLGIIIPLHCHYGFETILTDYYPPHRAKMGNAFLWILRISTGLALYGCYHFNTHDVGLVALVQKLWTGSK
jgi:succinate dehydrogenase (ubiquinone) membrane anchor subunit